MRRLSSYIVIALSASIPVSVCSAQQTAGNRSTNSERQTSLAPQPGPILGGDGTTNFIPLWATPSYLLSSAIYQTSGGSIGIGTATPVARLDVNGGVNAAQTYQIGGSNVLSIGNSSDGNIFLGVQAGSEDVPGSGILNTFSGTGAGEGNAGSRNAFFGYEAGFSNNSSENVFVGYQAGYSNANGGENAFFGEQAGYSNTSGNSNAFFGESAGASVVSGSSNSFFGGYAGLNATGSYNTIVGTTAGYNTNGNNNSFIGFDAGFSNPSGNNDIYIGNMGSSSGESNTIRIGGDVGLGYGAQTAAYIVGIYGMNVGGVPVQINSAGRLGAQTSSLRFKEQVRDMGDSTSALMNLRPVTFLYKPEYANGDRTLQYGLIAEEVAKVYPELVAYGNDGQPYAVRYQYIAAMLLNEVQKQYRQAEAQAAVAQSQRQEIENLKQQLQLQNATLQERLSRLELRVSSQLQTVAQEQQ